MSNLSRRQAADVTMQILQSTTRAYINIPDEYINYAASVALYVTRNWPGDDVAWNLPSAAARGPEMANAIQIYTNLCSKTLSFNFTRTGTWNLTADPGVANQGQDYLNQQAALPMPGAVAQYQGYRYVDNGATGNGYDYSAINSFRQLGGPASLSKGATSLYMAVVTGTYTQVTSTYAFEVADINRVARFAVTYSVFDDFTGIRINGRMARVYNGQVLINGAQGNASTMQLVGSQVDLGTAGVYPAGTGVQYFETAMNDDLRGYLINGTNIFEYLYINGPSVSRSSISMDLVQSGGGPALNPALLIPDAPGYSAVVSGNASYSRLTNLLNNLAGKLYNYMVSNVYLINYCHTNCHNNCHSSRGRR